VSRNQTASSNGATATLAMVSDGTAQADLGWGLVSPDTDGTVPCRGTGGAPNSGPFNLRNRWVEVPQGTTDANTGNTLQTATWEVTSDDLGNLEDITFAWAITYQESSLGSLATTAAYPAIGLVGKIGPISDETVPAPAAISDEPVVRFADNAINGTVAITIDHCVTNLLFPYVLAGGYDTGFAISNTSLDTAWNLTSPPTAPTAPANGIPAAIANWGVAANPQPFNTTPQAGTCNLYLFGSASAVNMGTTPATDTPVQAIASATTPNIAAGQTFAANISDIFALAAGTPISGYVIARCEFQFAHGFAYITSPPPASQPQGYLALVIPDRNILNADTSTGLVTRYPIRIAQPFSNAVFDEQGEILAE
jgi:hypothetical protein